MAAVYFLGARTFQSKKGTQCYKIQLLMFNRFSDFEIHDYFVQPDSDVWSMASMLTPGTAVRCSFPFPGEIDSIDEDKLFLPIPLNTRQKGGV